MLKYVRDAIVGLVTALASALVSVFGLSRLLRGPGQDAVQEKQEEGEVSGSHAQCNGDSITPRQPQPNPLDTPELPPGWTVARPRRLSPPTYWPVVMATAITLAMWGIATTYLLSGVGLLLFGLSLAGWVGDLRAEAEHD